MTGPIMVTLDDIYHPKLAYYYSISLIVSFVLTTIIIIPAIYIIFTQSKNAQVFKYLLINQLIWSYLFCWDCYIVAYVPLFPIRASYSVGISKYLPRDSVSWTFPLHLFIGLGYSQAFFFSCLYRVTYSAAFCKIQLWLEEPKRLLLLMISLLFVTSVIIVLPFIVINYDVKAACEELFKEYPVLQELELYEPLIDATPYSKPPNSTALSFALNASSIYLPIIYIANIVISFVFFRQALNPKNSFSGATRKRFVILVRAKIIQILSGSIFLSIPVFVLLIAAFTNATNGSQLSLIFQFFPSFNCFFEILALLYFITPYREYLVQWFKCS